MNNRMILIYGAGSGLGKSTIATFVHETLKENDVPVMWIREEASLELDAFAPYIREVESGRADNDIVLLTACERFIDECTRSESVFVIDSILPCLDWLTSANASIKDIRTFNDRVTHLLRELNPILIFLHGDLRIALNRAIENRGVKWAESLAAERCGDENPASLIAYFEKLRNVSDAILSDWPYERLDLETVSRDSESCRAEITAHLLQIDGTSA